MKSKIFNRIIVCFISILMVVGLVFGIYLLLSEIRVLKAHSVKPISNEMLSNIDLSGVSKLMIVAHPDDELIWGGGHLLDGGYFVVCITNGRNKTRKAEFESVIKETENQGIILEYPDKVNGKRDDWNEVSDNILSDIEKIIKLKKWDMIVTHNKDGEYGHQHHKMAHNIVIKAFENEKCQSQLYFFGKYYKASAVEKFTAGEIDVPEDMIEHLSDDLVARKTEISKLYKSQISTIEHLWHMAPYENFISYAENNKND